jgi:L,D-transpeptidase ErfK/SrfK
MPSLSGRIDGANAARQATIGRRSIVRLISRTATMMALAAVGGATVLGTRSFQDDLIGEVGVIMTRDDTTLLDVARDNDLGFLELMAANKGLNPWVPGIGTPIILPSAHILPDAPRKGIVINLAALRLFYFPPDGAPPRTYPIGIGVEGATTPLGKTFVLRKEANPAWFPPPSIRAERPYLPPAVPPGPDNPLGDFALHLAWPGYLIHGTNRPWGVGRRVSHGCIRLYPEDIAKLFPEVKVGTTVTVVDQMVALGWRGGQLYLEIHPTKRQFDELEETGQFTPENIPGLNEQIIEKAGAEAGRVNWLSIRRLERERLGYPVQITDN